MRLVSWNVNGIRACLGKGLPALMDELNADILCFQEVKARREQVEDPWLETWPHIAWNAAEKPGYSGVAVFSKIAPLSVSHGMNLPEHDTEGRVLTLEFPDFWLVNVYTPNSQDGLARLPYRMKWDTAFREYLVSLDATKPVVFCGDLNVAHEEIDLARPKDNRFSAGFSDEERADFTELLKAGFIDTFRYLYPDVRAAYSWWSFRGGARGRNVGWRIDYFGASTRLAPSLRAATIHPDIMGSDHCPVSIDLDLG